MYECRDNKQNVESCVLGDAPHPRLLRRLQGVAHEHEQIQERLRVRHRQLQHRLIGCVPFNPTVWFNLDFFPWRTISFRMCSSRLPCHRMKERFAHHDDVRAFGFETFVASRAQSRR